MQGDETLAGVRRVLVERLRKNVAIDRATDIVRDLGLDSVERLTLVVELENHFEVCFEPGDEEGIVTVGDLIGIVETCRRRNPRSGP